MKRSVQIFLVYSLINLVHAQVSGAAFDMVLTATEDAYTVQSNPDVKYGERVAGASWIPSAHFMQVQNNSGSSSKCYAFVKYQLPNFTGSVSGSVLEFIITGVSSPAPTGRTLSLYRCANTLSDSVTIWNDSEQSGGITWNTQPALGTLIDSKIYPANALNPSLHNTAQNSIQFSGANLDSYINSVGSNGTLSFVVVLSAAADSNFLQFGGRGLRRDGGFYDSTYAGLSNLNFNFVTPQPENSFLYRDIKIVEQGQGDITAYTRDHMPEMEAAVNFDGIQQTVRVRSSWPMAFDWYTWYPVNMWNDYNVDNTYNNLAATNFVKFTDTSIRATTVPWTNVGDMFNDSAFDVVIGNWRLFSHIMKTTGVNMFVYDPEQYSMGQPFLYDNQTGKSSHTFDEYKAQTRIRGQQLMEALKNEIPHEPLKILLYLGYNYGSTDLLGSFIDGMIDNARPIDRIYDGNEDCYRDSTNLQFWRHWETFKYRAKAEGKVGVSYDKFDRHYKNSNADWIDNYFHEGPQYTWYQDGIGVYGDNSTYIDGNLQVYWSPADFQRLLQYATKWSDGYLWVWGKTARWFDNATNVSNVPQPYKDALNRVRKKGKLERFEGMAPNLNVWERYNSSGSGDAVFMQANNMTIDGTGKSADYTTRSIKVSVGEKVSVCGDDNTTGGGGRIGLVLTNNSGGTEAGTGNDNRTLAVYWWKDNSTITATRVDSNGTMNSTLLGSVSSLDNVLEIERISSSEVKFTVFDNINTPLSTATYTVSDIPDDLYISLVANNAKATFDRLWIEGPYFEKFDGTVRNTEVWDRYCATGNPDSVFAQDEDLTIDATATTADYTTHEVRIGDNLSARVMPLSAAANGLLGVYLTSNVNSSDNLTNGSTLDDTRYIGIRWSNADKKFSAVRRDAIGTVSTVMQASVLSPFGRTYYFEIVRDNLTKATMKICDVNRDQVGDTRSFVLNDVPDKLYVSLVSNYATTKFDFGPRGVVVDTAIEGSVILGDYDPVDPTVPVSVRIELKQNGELIRSDQQILGSNDNFTIPGVPPGDYTVGIKACTWLKKIVPITKTEAALEMSPVKLVNGDLHGDNEIYFTSLSIVLARFGEMGDE